MSKGQGSCPLVPFSNKSKYKLNQMYFKKWAGKALNTFFITALQLRRGGKILKTQKACSSEFSEKKKVTR